MRAIQLLLLVFLLLKINSFSIFENKLFPNDEARGHVEATIRGLKQAARNGDDLNVFFDDKYKGVYTHESVVKASQYLADAKIWGGAITRLVTEITGFIHIEFADFPHEKTDFYMRKDTRSPSNWSFISLHFMERGPYQNQTWTPGQYRCDFHCLIRYIFGKREALPTKPHSVYSLLDL